MNRRERRNMQKQLGLNKHYKKQTREQMFQRWQDNLESGRMMEEDKRREVGASIQDQDEKKMNDVIEHLAEHISQRKNISPVDALVEAREEYENFKR